MKLLPRLVTALPKLWSLQGAIGVLCLFMLIGLEWVGRRSRSDVEDGFAILFLGLGAASFFMRTRSSSSSVLFRLSYRLRRGALRHLKRWLEFEVDLRESPPLKRSLPRFQCITVGVIVGAVPLALLLSAVTRSNLRDLLSEYFYVGYLVVLASLWTALLAIGTVLVLFGLVVSKELQRDPELGALNKLPPWLMPGITIAVLVVGLPFFAPWVAIAIGGCALLATVAVLLWPGSPELTLVWKETDGERRAANWSEFLVIHSGIVVAIPFLVAAAGAGSFVIDGWKSPGFSTMPVTGFLGIVVTWLGAAWSMAWLITLGVLLLHHRREDPAREVALRLHLVPRKGLASPSDLERLLTQRGCLYRQELGLSEEGEVRVELDPAFAGQHRFQEHWPLAIDFEELADPEVWQRIKRRDVVLRRRAFFRGLERIFKSVPRAALEEGEGVILAPQHWFANGLTRDDGIDHREDEDIQINSETIGPSYVDVMPLASRAHFREVTRALEIDLLYVERGVGYRQLRRALRILFDVYDMSGGSRPLSERDLQGVPGLKAIIHAMTFDEPFRKDDYPEPQYDGVGRARVLHLFRDRGEDETPVINPADIFGAPMPLGLGGGF